MPRSDNNHVKYIINDSCNRKLDIERRHKNRVDNYFFNHNNSGYTNDRTSRKDHDLSCHRGGNVC